MRYDTLQRMMPPDSFRPVKNEDGEKNVMRPQKNFLKGVRRREEKRRRYSCRCR